MKKIAFEWYAIVEGCFLVALGLFFLQSSHMIVGGTAGLAALATKSWGLSMGLWFFIVNAPFFVIAYRQMGKTFTLKSVFGIVLVSILADTMQLLISLNSIPMWLASFIGGGLIGVGLLLIFKNNASLGGVNILALFIEKKYGIHSGKVILSIDLLVVLLALTSYTVEQLLYSTLGFFVLTSVLGRYHKKAPLTQNHKVKTSSVANTAGTDVDSHVSPA
ncbi:YitT family protein [Psychrosphaera sp. B3R10]|uniref:YitT family protein n=1 Tax=unclassified Psychrosphaera TaxID=2641570 RepID=UPI001C08A647|nr:MULTISPECIES: YitT family protein [unclassified Psychrosphaera]MBU2880640.1 YitT family protein [Psychrosphaera sp. I2R16]MBU2990726.1 YitT family protein [Psychrosphaera sp. B3R10]MDO6720846.1 YitT family protein [Psychrosphaera sp. 1_MG-2023]